MPRRKSSAELNKRIPKKVVHIAYKRQTTSSTEEKTEVLMDLTLIKVVALHYRPKFWRVLYFKPMHQNLPPPGQSD